MDRVSLLNGSLVVTTDSVDSDHYYKAVYDPISGSKSSVLVNEPTTFKDVVLTKNLLSDVRSVYKNKIDILDWIISFINVELESRKIPILNKDEEQKISSLLELH